MSPLVSKASSSGMTVVFPDVCMTPATPIPIPIPYPNFATTALTRQKAAAQPTAAKQAVTNKSPALRRPGITASAGPIHKKAYSFNVEITGEVAQLNLELNRLHNSMQLLPATDPNAWQAVLQQYVVAAAALYVTKRDD